MDNNKQYVVSVGNAFVRDPITKQLICKADALTDSTIAQTLSKMEIKGGDGHKLLYVHNYEKAITVNLVSASFELAFFALNSGVDIENKLKDVYKFNEEITLDENGKGKLKNKPLAEVFVANSKGVGQSVSPNELGEIVLPNKKGEVVYATYQYNTLVDSIEFNANNSTKIYELILQFHMYDGETGNATTVEVKIPKFKPSGNFELTLNSSSPSAPALDGDALALDNGSYGSMNTIIEDISEITFSQLTTTPEEFEINVGDEVPVSVIGIRMSGVNPYAPKLMSPEDIIFATDDEAVAKFNEGTNTVKGVGKGETPIRLKLKSDETVVGVGLVIVDEEDTGF